MEFSNLEASSRITLDDGRVLTRCDQCRTMHAERNPPTIPPCNTCRVILMEENEEAANCYFLTRRQVVTADQGQIIDISIPAVKIAMDLFEVKNQRECLIKVRNLFHHFENERRKE